MTKHQSLLALAKTRRAAHWPGYTGIGDYHGGKYECDHVSPYTKSAGNVDATLMIILQDWDSHDRIMGPFEPERVTFGLTPSAPTNINLKNLLKTHCGLELAEVFATNLFPFVKPGKPNASIPSSVLRRAAIEFAIPQIKIVRPRIVACLGVDVFNALRGASSRLPALKTDEAVNSPFDMDGTTICCQAHTGPLGRNNRNRGGVDRVNPDWARMATALRA